MIGQQRRMRHGACRVIFFAFLAWGFIFVSFPALSAEGAWEKTETFDGVDLYRSRDEREGSLPFKAVAELSVPYQTVVMALVDAERKPDWAPKLKSTTLHSAVSPNCFEYSEYYETPWPFKDREFLLHGTVTYRADRIVFNATNSPNTQLTDPGHLTANIEVLTFEIIPLSESSTRVSMVFAGDLGGWIPPFVKTIIQKKWPVRFIQALQRHITSHENLETQRYLALKKEPVTFGHYH